MTSWRMRFARNFRTRHLGQKSMRSSQPASNGSKHASQYHHRPRRRPNAFAVHRAPRGVNGEVDPQHAGRAPVSGMSNTNRQST